MLNFLVSYAYLRSQKMRDKWARFIAATKPYSKHMLDSGGFSIATLGLSITLEDYMADLEAGLADQFWQYVSLDEPLNWPKSKRYALEMAANGLQPMNVLTADAPVEEAQELVELNPHICIAGGVNEDLPWYADRIAKVWKQSEGKARMHGLGFTRRVAAVRTKVFSIDSSTWSVGKQYGNFTIFDPHYGCRQYNTKRTLTKNGLQTKPELVRLFMRHGVRMTHLKRIIDGETRSRAQGTIIDLLSCRAWYEYSEFMRQRGVTFFFAVNALNAIAPLMAVVKADLDGVSIPEIEDYSWKLYDSVKDDFDFFLTEVTTILRRLTERETQSS